MIKKVKYALESGMCTSILADTHGEACNHTYTLTIAYSGKILGDVCDFNKEHCIYVGTKELKKILSSLQEIHNELCKENAK